MDEQQALAAFNHAAEEMRVLRDHEWLITNYAMIAYSALVAGSFLVAEQSWPWRSTFVSLLAFVLVVGAAWQAERVLWYANDLREVAYHRLQDAVHRLEVVCEIHQKYKSTKPSGMRFWVRLWKSDPEPSPPCGTLARPGAGEASRETDDDFPVRPGLGIAVGLGALFASQIIILRIPPLWVVWVLEAVVVVLGWVFVNEIIL